MKGIESPSVNVQTFNYGIAVAFLYRVHPNKRYTNKRLLL